MGATKRARNFQDLSYIFFHTNTRVRVPPLVNIVVADFGGGNFPWNG
jgi:hypothetical protein